MKILKEKLLGLVDNSMSQAMSMLNGFNDVVASIDWDKQFEYLNEKKDELLKKGNDLLGEFTELMKQVKNNISDFEVTVPFDETIGEKFNCSVDEGKLNIEVTYKDETSERSNKTSVLVPQNCNVAEMSTKYNPTAKTMTVIIPKVIAEVEEKKTEESVKPHKKVKYTGRNSTTPRVKRDEKEMETIREHASSKLMDTIRRNTSRLATPPRGSNGRFVRRTPQAEVK